MSELSLPLATFFAGVVVGLIVFLFKRHASEREAENLRIRIAELGKERETDAERIRWTEKAETHMRDAFEALAGRALKDNSSQITERAKTQIDGLLSPLNKNLSNLESHVRELESKREKAYGSLSQQLKQLGEMHGALQNTTASLAQALRSPTVKGRWGELQLRRVVEMSGMSGHVDFDEQAGAESGRPDMVVHLPNGGILPLDSKVPLDSYLDAMESANSDVRSAKLIQHAKAVRARVRELGLKSYWDQFDRAPDFVVMFVPNESSLGAAFEVDAELLEYAISNRVLISSPVNLLALLRTVAYGWQQHQVTENAQRIALEGKELHKRVTTFVDYLTNLGQALKKSVDQYNAAVRSLEGRLLPAVRRFEEMGAASKELESPQQIEVDPRLPAEPSREREAASVDEKPADKQLAGSSGERGTPSVDEEPAEPDREREAASVDEKPR
ncbi:MAG: DNA recombination protein RmuC [Candidatus Latescibacterota bacterium]|nr:MAG: DNA recombination protein RmuC [Candidatus Latescibacterota bacterium]